jgi:hypothetical protein
MEVRVPDITTIVSELTVAIKLCKHGGDRVSKVDEQRSTSVRNFKEFETTGSQNLLEPLMMQVVTIDRQSWHSCTWAAVTST